MKVLEHRFDAPLFHYTCFVSADYRTIILNSARSLAQRNYDCGRCFVRTELCSAGSGEWLRYVHDYEHTPPKRADILSWREWEGAAELLVPQNIFCGVISDALPGIKNEKQFRAFLSSAAGFFQVEESLICYRIRSLRHEFKKELRGENHFGTCSRGMNHATMDGLELSPNKAADWEKLICFLPPYSDLF